MRESAFLTTTEKIDRSAHIVVRYRFETSKDWLAAAVDLSKEQSFSCIEDPVQEERLIQRFAAKILTDTLIESQTRPKPSLWSRDAGKGPFYIREVSLAFPRELFGDSLALLLSTVIGEIHNIGKFTGMKVMDIEFPADWERLYGGPRFGLQGLRQLLGVVKSPLLISPVKPCVGLSPDEFAQRVYECLVGGFHGVKDDELLLNPAYCPLAERVQKTADALKRAEDKTGQKKIYFAFVGSDITDLDELTDIALRNGATGLMYAPLVNGLDIIRKYKGTVPMIAHNNLTYGLCRSDDLGISFRLLAKIQRLCGADVMVCPAPYGSFDVMSAQEHRDNLNAAIGPEMQVKPLVLGLSGSQSPSTLYQHCQDAGHGDFAILPGAAVYEHPSGIRAGAASFTHAANAWLRNEPLAQAALSSPELQTSIDKFPGTVA